MRLRFALVDDQRVEATPKRIGLCPSCGETMIARCGTRRVWHWAHRGVRCDDWWETETAWHRQWKDQFPVDWQEVVCQGYVGGERHIADVMTSHGLVIEFQHSRLRAEERREREAFYGNMAWVIDGTRLPSDVTRFMGSKDYFVPTFVDGLVVCNILRSFPSDWSWSAKLVIFDFAGKEATANSDLWCLFPGRVDAGRMLLAPLPRREFVRMAHEQSFIYEVEGIMALMVDRYRKEEAKWFGRSPRETAHLGRRR
jgi:hypothetical protein